MPQKLSAMKYIKNNKKRISVLIVSLGLCFVLTYLTQFLLSSTEETFRPLCLESTRRIQYVNLAGSSLGLDITLPIEELLPLYEQEMHELAGKLKTHEGIKEAYYAELLFCSVNPAVGSLGYEMPLVEAKEVPVVLEHFGAKLVEGRLPENPGEIVLDEASLKHKDYELDGYYNEESYGTAFKIVGVLESDCYFGCGIPSDELQRTSMIIILSEGIDDISAELAKEGIVVRDTYDSVVDYMWGSQFLQEEVVDVIATSTQYIYVGIMVLLSISLIIVYTMYLRDRHDEWCLYCSIGYSRKTICLCILRELLFTFVVALLIGAVIIVGSELLLDAVMIQPKGLRCKYFHPRTIGEILCSYVLIFGILQIPIRYALYRIRTVDSIDDDLY